MTGLALVTGATSGIGRELALELARHGWSLVLVARDRERLEETAVVSRNSGSPDVRVLAADLAEPAGLDRLLNEVTEIDALVNAAGMGNAYGFPDAPLTEELRQLDLNVRSTLVLAHTAARAMRTRGRGHILNVGSTAGIWSQGTYAGSKAWVHAASYGLAAACRPHGVSVTVLIPGFTRTEFHERSGTLTSGVPEWLWLDARQVAQEGVAAMLRGDLSCVPGRQYRVLTAIATRLGPVCRRRMLSRLARLRPKDDNDLVGLEPE